MKVKVSDLYIGALIKANFLCSYVDNQWHFVKDIKHQSNGVYLAVEGYKGAVFPSDYEVELKD